MNWEQIIPLILNLFQNNKTNQNNNPSQINEDYSSTYWSLPNYEQPLNNSQTQHKNFNNFQNYQNNTYSNINTQQNINNHYEENTQKNYSKEEQNSNNILNLLSKIDIDALLKILSYIQNNLKSKQNTKTEKKEIEPSFISHLTKIDD